MAQKYQVLARRYRPQRFADVVGQEAVLQTLKNALKRDAIAHAYLFSGSRGVGKTTLARLFAKALNCANPVEGEPCNQCPSCLEIASGQSLDVIEIDGASNRGIDDIRQINETVGFAPSHGKYKIYIIDEVHMLTKEAFNALLKTLEEPPEQAKFFFATTEPHKVLPTIISRCQRFDLGRLLPEQIGAKLASIASDLGRAVEPEALHLLSHFADGSLRDAESLLDQLLCFAKETVTASDIQNALGLAPKELFFSFDEAFGSNRLSYAFELVAQLFNAGKDLSHFLDQMIEHYRHLAVCKTLGAHALRLPKDLAERYGASAKLYTQPQTLSALDLLIKAETQMAKSASARVCLELTLLQILRLKNRLPIEALVRRLGELEEKLASGIEEKKIHAGEERSSALPAHPIAEEKLTVEKKIAAKVELCEEKPSSLPAHAIKQENPTSEIEKKPLELPAHAVAKEEFIVEKKIAAEVERNEEQKTSPLPAHAMAEEKLTVEKKIAVETELRKGEESPSAVAALKPVPFHPVYGIKQEAKPPVVVEPVKVKSEVAPIAGKHPSHYETLMRFTAVELEGTIKK